MITIKKEHLLIIQEIEDKLNLSNSSSRDKFKIATSELFIRNFSWPFGVIKNIIKIPDINLFPTMKLKVWAIFIISILNIKKYHKPKKTQLTGYLTLWPFMKTTNINLSADAIFYKESIGINLYFHRKEPLVVKYLLSNSEMHQKLMCREIEMQKLANGIEDSNIFIPKIYNSTVGNYLNFFSQELVSAKAITHFSEKTRKNLFKKVFSFMFKFYKSTGITLKSPSEYKLTEREFSEEYYKKYNDGQEIINKFNDLLKQNKKMLWGSIHGDLSVNNVLVETPNKLWLIDWGKSREYYLVNELKNSNYDASELFIQLLNHFDLNKNEIYSFKEQIFIERYISAANSVHDRVTYNKLGNYQFDYIENTVKLLSKIDY